MPCSAPRLLRCQPGAGRSHAQRLWRAEAQAAELQQHATAGSKRRRLSEQPQQSSSCAHAQPAAALFALAACFLVAVGWAQGIKQQQQQQQQQPAGALMKQRQGPDLAALR